MPILKVKNKETGQWEQVGVSTEATGAQIAAHNASPEAHADIRQLIADLHGANEAMVAAIADQVQSKIFYATIGTNWTEDEVTGAKTQMVDISEVTAEHTAKVDHYFSGEHTNEGYAAYVEEENQFLTCVTNGFAETVAGGIKFTIFGSANTIPIPIIVEVV